MNTNYGRLLLAYFLSAVGDWLYRLALPLLLFQQTHSALVMSIAYALTFLPYVLVMPFGGVIADRLKRQKILIYGDGLAAVLTLILACVVTWFKQDLILIYILVFLIASVTSVYHPAFQSFLPSVVVQKEKLGKANSYILSSDNLILLLGPLCSGLIIALLGTVASIYFNALSYLISCVLIMGIKPAIEETLAKAKITIVSVLKDLREAGKYAVGNPTIKFGCILFIFSNFGMQVFYANFMYYLADTLHLTPNQIGLTFAISGLGAIVGGILAPYLPRYVSEGRLLLWCCLGESLSLFMLLLTHNFVAVGLAWGGVAASLSITMVTYFTLRQRVVPREFLGRTVAVTRVISFSAIPIASVVGGLLLQHFHSIHMLIWLGGSVLLFSACFGWFSPLNQPKEVVLPLAQEA